MVRETLQANVTPHHSPTGHMGYPRIANWGTHTELQVGQSSVL